MKEVLLIIFQHLDLKSINNCAALCSTFYNISKDGSLYTKVSLRYDMNIKLVASLVERCTRPKEVDIIYKTSNAFITNNSAETEDYSEFNEYVQILLRKCGEHIIKLNFESCKDSKTLECIADCINLKELGLARCKGTFTTLHLLSSLREIKFVDCHFPGKTVNSLLKNNEELKEIHLLSNNNVNTNEISEILSKYNPEVEELELGENRRLKSRYFKLLARLTKLRTLEIWNGPGCDSDPDLDSIQHLAAGCPYMEKLVLMGRKEITDENLIPALHMFTRLKTLCLRGVGITIKSCREACLTLPLLKELDVYKCSKIKKAQDPRPKSISMFSPDLLQAVLG
ncbi:unnamed protein product [Acanthoscelides obtectus]|uniref:F-box domain-containing protein n=1 Tax=Acanthoscelides obtectus TaxID=200917 RepID=A0A9P0JID2_ACAOB|nr:unnamed protein product [Acanthoscelides obtectus]CAK1678443.1 hypothetical protein AOBTE_LOCUS31910 [Acanthoscelides obtectus]